MACCPALQDAKVERFVVVHGQIILNQFRHYPNKAVQASAFAAALKSAMESRRHSKLYMGSAKAKSAVSGNRNPMKVAFLHELP
jgi:DNA (cytosine-5)-methyltransferase 1